MKETDIIEDTIPVLSSIPSIIMVAGVGGAGGNAVDHMHRMGINGVNMAVFNTDSQALEKSPVKRRILLGKDGLGAGNYAEEGARKAKESGDLIRNTFESLGTKMLFIAAGMGGGTGTGAAPVIASIAQEMGILTVGIITVVEENEGDLRVAQARQGVREMSKHVDALIVISNAAISKLYGSLSIQEGYDKANEIVARAAKGIAEIITTKSDIVNVDFKDVERVIRNSGRAVMGVSEASGDDRVLEALSECLRSPLLGDTDIRGAKNVLINFAYSDDHKMTIEEKNQVLNRVQDVVGVTDDHGHRTKANIIWGTSRKDDLGDKVEIIVVVSGFPEKRVVDDPVVEVPATAQEATAAADSLPAGPDPAASPAQAQDTPTEPARHDIRITRPADKYSCIDDIISQPAYLRFDVKLRNTLGNARNVGKEESEPEEEGPRIQDLFGNE